MEIQLCIVVCVLISTGLVDGGIYRMPAVILDTPDNSTCPSDRQLEAARTNISNSIKDILDKISVVPACGGFGWRRIAFLDMTDPNQICPQAWRPFNRDSVRACGRQTSNVASCDSVQYSPNGYKFTQVCGRITGYQYASPDGLVRRAFNIDAAYVDGVSVTYGVPRQHIWTFYAGVQEGGFGCCYSTYSAPSQVGENYFCDTGNPDNADWRNAFFPTHPLWDGIAGCPSNTTCCAPHSGPWFHVHLTTPTTDSIEIRICGEEPSANENTPLELIEIYVK